MHNDPKILLTSPSVLPPQFTTFQIYDLLTCANLNHSMVLEPNWDFITPSLERVIFAAGSHNFLLPFGSLFSSWNFKQKANGMSEPHLKFCLYKLKKKLRLELHRRYSGTSLKTWTWDYGKSYSQSCKNLFWPFLTVFCLFLLTKRKAHKVKSWSRKPYDTIQCFSGLGCEP